MIQINLLPEKVRSSESLKRNLFVGIACSILVVALIGVIYFKKLQELKKVQEEISKVQAEMDSPELKKIVQDVEEYSAQQKTLDDQQALLNKLREKQVVLVKVIDVLPDVLPQQVWLTSFSTSVVNGKQKLSMVGTATSNEEVARFYSNLENHGSFKNVSLDNAPVAGTSLGASVVNFTISCDFEG